MILQSQNEIDQSRRELRRRCLSSLPRPWICSFLQRCGLTNWLRGDLIKSWDVLQTALFIEMNLQHDEAIVDLGAYHSEILPVLHRMGYSQLHGVDLNTDLLCEPYGKQISYTVADFHHTPYNAGSFSAVTSISAIEHGHNLCALMSEVSRLLQPGGYFLCSTDYWPTKIDTSGIEILGMSWTIFSEMELRNLLDTAHDYGLVPVGLIDFSAAEPVVHFAGKDYTFAWFALRKI